MHGSLIIFFILILQVLIVKLKKKTISVTNFPNSMYLSLLQPERTMNFVVVLVMSGVRHIKRKVKRMTEQTKIVKQV